MTKEEIQNIYNYSKSKAEIVKKLKIRPNQNGENIDKEILSYFSCIGIFTREEISRKKLSEHWLDIQKRDYYLNPKKCLNCNKIIPFERIGSNYCCNFCGKSSGNKKRGKRTDIEKQKISKTLRKYNKEIGNTNIAERIELINQYYNDTITLNELRNKHPEIIKYCKECKKEFVQKLRKNSHRISDSLYCCKECHDIGLSNEIKQLRQKEIESGKFQGWKTRNITSYAEKFWENVLNNNNISYIKEKKVDKYFLDFVIEVNGINIDLEIDGKQHKYNDRKESDIIRDKFLTSNGYKVYRIPWNSINSDSGKVQMKNKIEDFLKFYKSFK